MIISPSIASSDVCNIQSEVEFAQKHFSHIHLDIEDGVYLHNLTFGMKTVRGICGFCTTSLSVHLEVWDPMTYLEDLASLPVDDVFIHTDHLKNPEEVIRAYQSKGLHTGAALSDRDLGRNISSVLGLVDSVLILSALIDDPFQRYSETMGRMVASLAAEGKWNVWADGGITADVLALLVKKQVYAAVMGRAIFSDKKAAETLFETI